MSFPGDKGAQTALTEIYLNQDESSLIAETEEEEEKCHCGHCRVETRGGEMGVEGTRYTALYTTLYRLYRLYNSLHRQSAVLILLLLLASSLHRTFKIFSSKKVFFPSSN